MACSLWLSPPEPLYGRLSGLIGALASRLGTEAFAPHITLLSGLAGDGLDARLLRLGRGLAPFEVRLQGVGLGTEFFHCVFAGAASTPALLAARSRATEVFGVGGSEAFDPHLSLAYGNLGSAEKNAARAAAGDLAALSFSVDSIDLMDTGGEVARWRRLARVPLSS